MSGHAPAAAQAGPNLVIRAKTSLWSTLELKAAWKQRELAFLFALRDIKLRYKQTALGLVWTALQPLLTTGVLTIFFGKLANLDSEGVPYPLFCLAGVLPWNCFAACISRGSTSLAGNAHLVTKIYFPRILIPVAALLPPFVDLAVGLVLLLVASLAYGVIPTLSWLWEIPFLVGLLFATALGMSLTLGAINVRFRDVSNILPFLIQLGMFATPVIYGARIVPEALRPFYGLNPMVAVTTSFRATLLGRPWDWVFVGEAIVVTLLMLAAGLVTFSRTERHFADAI